MEVAAKSKAKLVCGFCRLGEEVEDVCGPLYTSDVCNAHKKCMQYSALLVQYRAKTFGGFKKHKVMEEIKRGRNLSCSLCKSRKKSKTKSGCPGRPTGASCGCAIGTCRKTYHYYCASTDSSTQCRRIEVMNKTGKAAVQYRIFCSDEHRRKYENSEKGVKFNYNDSSSDSESDMEDEDSASDVRETPKSGKRNNKSRASSSKKRKAKEESSESEADYEIETESEISKQDSFKEETSPTVTDTPKKIKKDNSTGTELKVVALADSSMRTKEELPPEGPSDTEKPVTDTFLCIMEQRDLKDKLEDRIRQIVASQYNVPESAIYFWSDHSQNIFRKEHMIYFLKDVAQYVHDSNTQSLERIIISPSQSDVDKYNHNVRFNAEYMDTDLLENVYTKLRDNIGVYFCHKRNTSGIDCGAGYYLSEVETMFVAVTLNDLIDPNHKIRRFISEPCHVYQLDCEQQLLDPKRAQLSKEEHARNSNTEKEVLLGWLDRQMVKAPRIRIRPKEMILREKSMDSTTCLICTRLQDQHRSSNNKAYSTVIFLLPVDTQIMSYGPYCQAVISAFVQEDLRHDYPVYCVLDVDHLEGVSSVIDLIPALPDHVKAEAICGLNPTMSPISCFILKLSVPA